jgi:hypothetical protein
VVLVLFSCILKNDQEEEEEEEEENEILIFT